ncbi:MAG TPA: Phenylacetic acid catabolic protein [Longimicrobium sp.]|nr:Phenylacetic acid catabolic protein [Longimicrobium sp.]
MSTVVAEARVDRAEQLAEDVRAPLRDLILALADSKRVLGLRYSDRMLGAPTLEAGIAASSMAQDEWGHGRLTYALLGDLGEEPKALEHSRSAAEYRSIGALDRGFGSWSELVAAGLLIDGALTAQYGALVDSRYTPVHNRVQKMLDEERFHFQYAAGWARRIAAVAELRPELAEAVALYLPDALRWLGRDDDPGVRRLVEEGVVREEPSALRRRLLQRIGPVLEEIGAAEAAGVARDGNEWTYARELDWSGWNDATRRSGGSLDEETAARARGDKNRALLLD